MPELPFDEPTANFYIDHGKILMIGEVTDKNGRRTQVLCSLNPDTGELSQGKEICELDDDRIRFANYGDGYLYLREFSGNLYTSEEEMSGEEFTILDYSCGKLARFRFEESLPQNGYSYGIEIHGTDPEYPYCRAQSVDELALYRIPVDGSPTQFFTEAGDGGKPSEMDSEAETGEEPGLEDDINPMPQENFPDLDPTVSGIGNAFCQTSEYIFFPENVGQYGQSQVVCMANKKTGMIETLCGKPDCDHNSESCEAWVSSQGTMSAAALTATDSRVYLAMFDFYQENTLQIRAYDLETKTWSRLTELSFSKAGIAKKNYTLNDKTVFFHRDCLYFYCVRNRHDEGEVDGGMKNTENTIIIYELPLLRPDQGCIILEEEYPDANFVSIRMTAYGEALIYGVSSAETEGYDEENGGYVYKNELTQFFRYNLNSGKTELLGEEKSQNSMVSLYPEQDGLHINVYRYISFADGRISGNYAILHLDYETRMLTETAETDDMTMLYFCGDGYFRMRKRSRYIDIEELSCIFYDLKGEEIRSFSYPMPEGLLPEELEEWEMWHCYLGADQWNLYIRDSFYNAEEGYSVVYAAPISGDQPVVYQLME